MFAPLQIVSLRRRRLIRRLAQGSLLASAGGVGLLGRWLTTSVGPATATAAVATLPELEPEPIAELAVVAPDAMLDTPIEGPVLAESESVAAPAPLVAPLPLPAAPRPLRPRQSATLPIVMYHHVDDLPRTVTDPFRRDLTLPTIAFRQQLELLESNQVQTVSLADLTSHFAGHEPLPERSVVLTFDDGYEDNYRLAFQLLRQFGMTATFFIVPNLVEQPGYMTWDQLRTMQRYGMSIESHSLDHVDLAIQPLPELRRQLRESRRVLEANLLRAVSFLAYPSGKYSPLVVAESRAAGYEAAVTVNYGLQQRSAAPFELNRVRVKGADTVDSFAAKLVPSHWSHLHGRFGG